MTGRVLLVGRDFRVMTQLCRLAGTTLSQSAQSLPVLRSQPSIEASEISRLDVGYCQQRKFVVRRKRRSLLIAALPNDGFLALAACHQPLRRYLGPCWGVIGTDEDSATCETHSLSKPFFSNVDAKNCRPVKAQPLHMIEKIWLQCQ